MCSISGKNRLCIVLTSKKDIALCLSHCVIFGIDSTDKMGKICFVFLHAVSNKVTKDII